MTMVITTIVFIALTVLFAVWHLRRNRSIDSASSARICPRCQAPLAATATQCGVCHAPLQAFEMVRAPITSGPAAAKGSQHAVVRADLCVGCGACVDVCPEPGAIRLVEKLAVVDRNLCKAHASCVAACPVGGIFIGSGDAVQRLQVPELDTGFESNVPGLYVVGELGGRGLIKNAVNEGRLAAEHAGKALARTSSDARGGEDRLDLVIVGSGPAGLSAALEADKAGLRYLVLEQGTLSDTIARYPRKKLLLAEPVRVPIYGELWIADSTKEELLEVWQTLIRRRGLRIETGRRVTAVVPEHGGFLVETVTGPVRARRVILAMGRRGTPRRLEVPGEELSHIFYDIVEMEAFAGQRVLVVGGGDSALESAIGLSLQEGTTVTLSHRGTDFARAKQRNRSKLEERVAAGRIELLLGSEVREIRSDVAILEHQGAPRLVPIDVVIVRIGGEAAYPFLERAGVRIVEREIALPATANAGQGAER